MIPRPGRHKVNGYVKAVLALDAVRRKREAKRKGLAAPTSANPPRAAFAGLDDCRRPQPPFGKS
jgi:hypothetical protein